VPRKTDGKITLDDDFAKTIGFTSDKFTDASYLWRMGKEIWISFIECKHPGNGDFSRLIQAICKHGYAPAVPTPLGLMKEILKRWGWTRKYEYSDEMGEWVEMWRPTHANRT
jgi:hypothetical protein